VGGAPARQAKIAAGRTQVRSAFFSAEETIRNYGIRIETRQGHPTTELETENAIANQVRSRFFGVPPPSINFSI
jgi:hypothetical protein